MSCLDLLSQQACDLREESKAASQKYKKSVERGFAATVEEGWELLSQLKTSKKMRMQRRYTMLCNGTPPSSRVTGANMLVHNAQATGLQYAGTPYQRHVGSMEQGFRAPTMAQQQARMPQHQSHSQQQRPLMPQQQALSNSAVQWTGGKAVPHGMYVEQQNGARQQQRQHMPNSGAHSQHPATQQPPTMQHRMPSQQQHLASNGHGHWMNVNATPNRMSLHRGQAGQQQQTKAHAPLQFTGTEGSLTSSYATTGIHSSVFRTPTSTPVGMSSHSQYAPKTMRLQRPTAGTSSMQQNNASYAQPQQQNQFYGSDSNRVSSASINLGSYPPSHVPGTVTPASSRNSGLYPNAVAPHHGMPALDSFNRPTSKTMNSWSPATSQQAMPQKNAYGAQPQNKALNAADFFSLSEQDLDEVLASLADSNTTSQQKTPTTNATTGQVAKYIAPPGAATMQHHSGSASVLGTVMNASQDHGNAPTATPTVPASGAQPIHISVPAGAEVLEVRESSVHSGAYEIVTTAGTFMAYGQNPSVDQQPQRELHHQIAQ